MQPHCQEQSASASEQADSLPATARRTQPHQRTKIIHIDCDCFFAAVEMRDDPRLIGVPIAVGGTPDSRGVVATCNYEARAHGVRSAMPAGKALRLCPALRFIRPRFDVYKAVSRQVRGIFADYTDLIEPLSLDEAYLDVTESPHLGNRATRIAREIQKRIAKEVGITASAGVAPNKFLAKIASDWKKPAGLFVIQPQQADAFVRELPVKKLHGVGRVTAERLHRMGLHTCADLRAFPQADLLRAFGSFGIHLWQLAHGIDERPVEIGRRRSLSVENTFDSDLPTAEDCIAALPELLDDFHTRLARLDSSYRPGKPFVKVKFHDFSQTTLERQGAELDAGSYHSLIREAFARGNKPVRLLGIGTRLIDLQEQTAVQLLLFEGDGQQRSADAHYL